MNCHPQKLIPLISKRLESLSPKLNSSTSCYSSSSTTSFSNSSSPASILEKLASFNQKKNSNNKEAFLLLCSELTVLKDTLNSIINEIIEKSSVFFGVKHVSDFFEEYSNGVFNDDERLKNTFEDISSILQRGNIQMCFSLLFLQHRILFLGKW